MSELKMTWYGRCCFLLEISDKKILLDPYDTFHNVDIGLIEADYLFSSSIAHDHGHIGASPKSYTYNSPEYYELENNIIVQGIQSHEYRGSSNVIFNIQYKDLSITNFADWGEPRDLETFSEKDLAVLKSTDIAFVRPNQLPETNMQCAELALRVCEPKILILYHFYPENFIRQNPEDALIKNLAHYKPLIDRFVGKLEYQPYEISGYTSEINLDHFKNKTLITFSGIHPQVQYMYDK